MITLEDGLIKTCLLPAFSALLIAFNASAKTEDLVIFYVCMYVCIEAVNVKVVSIP